MTAVFGQKAFLTTSRPLSISEAKKEREKEKCMGIREAKRSERDTHASSQVPPTIERSWLVAHMFALVADALTFI